MSLLQLLVQLHGPKGLHAIMVNHNLGQVIGYEERTETVADFCKAHGPFDFT
jgi:tRNA(Ile)-lysidine synthase TilS/MesJ